MRPRTKREFKALEETKRLPALSKRHFEWAKSTLMRHDCYTWVTGRGSKKRRLVWCLDCGHVEYLPVDTDLTGFVCPACGSSLRPAEWTRYPRPKTMCTCEQFIVPRVHDGEQVFDCIELYRDIRSIGDSPEYSWKRRFCVWIDGSGRETITTMQYARGLCAFRWREDAPWVIGRHSGGGSGYYLIEDVYDISGLSVAPHGRFTEELTRRGLRSLPEPLAKLSLADLSRALMRSNVAETLLKTGQHALLTHLVRHENGGDVERLWPSVRIALRHGLKIGDDASLYMDYLKGLEDEGKDMRSPKYLCPENLVRAHDAQVRRAHERDRREQARIELAKAESFEEALEKRIKAAVGVVIADGDIEISPLRSVRDFLEEGEALHHCVFQMGYYKRETCLILGAKVHGERTETIEVDLRDFSIAQCRGACNMDSPYHERIVKLMESSMGRLREAYRRAQ